MNRILTMFLPIVMASAVSSTTVVEENETYISDTAYEACVDYGEQYNICPELLMAIIEAESRGQPDVENGGCKGLMQISVKWHSGRMEKLGVEDIFDERSNILVGADFLSELFEKYQDAAIVLMVYHGERNAVQKAENGEISSYAEGILERSAELEEIHEKKMEEEYEMCKMFEDLKVGCTVEVVDEAYTNMGLKRTRKETKIISEKGVRVKKYQVQNRKMWYRESDFGIRINFPGGELSWLNQR